MSKRLQVIIDDDEYVALAKAARERSTPISEFVRESVRETLAKRVGPSPEERLATVLRYTRFTGPTGDIEQILAEIERGREA